MKRMIVFVVAIILIVSNCVIALAEEVVEKVKPWRKESSGMAADVEPTGNIVFPGKLKVIDEKYVFKPTDDKAVWWSQFRPGMFFTPPTMVAKWYAPDGSLYKEEKIHSFTESEAIKAELPIKGTDVAKWEGKWKVVIYHRKKLYDEAWFVIGELKGSQKEMGED